MKHKKLSIACGIIFVIGLILAGLGLATHGSKAIMIDNKMHLYIQQQYKSAENVPHSVQNLTINAKNIDVTIQKGNHFSISALSLVKKADVQVSGNTLTLSAQGMGVDAAGIDLNLRQAVQEQVVITVPSSYTLTKFHLTSTGTVMKNDQVQLQGLKVDSAKLNLANSWTGIQDTQFVNSLDVTSTGASSNFELTNSASSLAKTNHFTISDGNLGIYVPAQFTLTGKNTSWQWNGKEISVTHPMEISKKSSGQKVTITANNANVSLGNN
ncbi:MAG: DUF4097 domain-containing protein [Streptococcaceae bacterium]|jgi:hypothetical protein|nr:DUF4097 domain-containing protein [Streptococcaceae bacterium]